MLSRARDVGFARGDRLVVAFSGGRDSLALAAALRRTRAKLGLELSLVHVDHRLRSTSGEEAAKAENLAAALGLEFRVIVVAAPLRQLHPHVGVEEAARRERYRLLFQTAEEEGARVVVTAHHQGDQAETVLLHLLRGGGVHGATGMSERSAGPLSAATASDISPKDKNKDAAPWLWRPLLQESREVIDDYVARLGLEWIEDPSNDDVALRRNAVRRRVLPVLEEHVPGATAALARFARLAAADDEVLEHFALVTLAGEVDPGGRLAASALREQPIGLQRRMVRRWLIEVTELRGLTADRTDALLDLARARRGEKVIEVGEGWTVRLESGMLRACREGRGREETQ